MYFCALLKISAVYDFIPLKQEFKLAIGFILLFIIYVYDFIPLKQGLKHSVFNMFAVSYSLFMNLFH